jgi:hypothetical protein
MTRLLFLAMLLLAPACVSVARQEELDSKKERWHTIQVAAPSDRVLWQLTLVSLESQGYPRGAGNDPGARQLETGWKTDLQPFRGEGKRRRAIVRIRPLEPGQWELEARVRVESNENLVTPLDPQRAEWKPAADDATEAQVLLQHVRARLQPELEVGDRSERSTRN